MSARLVAAKMMIPLLVAKPYSEETARIIDEEVSKIIEKAYQKAVDLLNAHRTQLEQLSAKLLEKEVIFKDDLEEILGPRQWKERNPANELKPENETKPGIEPSPENA